MLGIRQASRRYVNKQIEIRNRAQKLFSGLNIQRATFWIEWEFALTN